MHEGGWELVFGVDGQLVVIAPDGKRRGAAALADRFIDPMALRRRLRAMRVAPEAREFTGEWGGEPMTRFARDVIVGAIWDAIDGPTSSVPAGAGIGGGAVIELVLLAPDGTVRDARVVAPR